MPLSNERRRAVLDLVKRYWGFDSLRPMQEDAIAAALDSHDSLVVLPTGGGKSLCYQVPPLADDRTDIVVSPLISLMKDQVDGLLACGYPAGAIHSGLGMEQRRIVERELLQGRLRLLFVAPERLLSGASLRLISQLEHPRFAIDEAHCISHWGHDFRPEYRQLEELRRLFPKSSIHAFTATATQRVREDIASQLGLHNPAIFVGSFDRPNLVYRIVPRVKLERQVLQIVRRHNGEAVIIYCLSRRDTEALAEFLQGKKISAAAYHAGLSAQMRHTTQENFAAEKLDVVVATVAFGMGIDRSNVRCVVHACVPKSVEHYQQETGRAGRDGLPAECVLLYSPEDIFRWESLIETSSEEAQRPKEVVAAAKDLLSQVQRFCNTVQCRHDALVRYFGERYSERNCNACDVCLGEVEGVMDATVLAQKILSCVARVEQRFGTNHVVDVLAGANTAQIRKFGHDRLSTFGLIPDMPRESLINCVYQLVDQGLLTRSTGDRPTLSLNDASWEVLRKQREVRLLRPKAEPIEATRLEDESWSGVDRGLFEHLRAVRRSLAEQRGVPAFVIFGDTTLRELARRRPSSASAFRLVPGIGTRKEQDFGEVMVAEIVAYCTSRGVPLDQSESQEVLLGATRRKRPRKSQSARIASKMFANGAGVDEVVAATGKRPSTVYQYLAEYIEATTPASIERWVDSRTYNVVRREIHGEERLKPIFDRLDGKIPYELIKLVRSHARSQAVQESHEQTR